MPIYDYECGKCGKQFQVKHSMKERYERCEEVEECEEGGTLTRGIHNFSIKQDTSVSDLGSKPPVVNEDAEALAERVQRNIEATRHELAAAKRELSDRPSVSREELEKLRST